MVHWLFKQANYLELLFKLLLVHVVAMKLNISGMIKSQLIQEGIYILETIHLMKINYKHAYYLIS